MAMAKCKECGEQVSSKADACPHCGAPVKRGSGNNQYGCGTLIAVVLVFGFLGSFMGDDDSTSPTSQPGSSPSGGASTDTRKGIERFAHQTINIRSGPSTDDEVAGQVGRGDSIRIASGDGDWREIVSGPHEGAYIYSPLLEEDALPALEVTSWNWHADPDFGVDGSVVWNAEVQNNTGNYIEQVRLEFSSYDAEGNIVTQDTSYASGLSPGGTASTKGYATYYGQEDKGRLRITGGY